MNGTPRIKYVRISALGKGSVVSNKNLAQEPLDLNTFLAQAPAFTMIMYTFPIQPDHLKVLQDYAGKHLTPLVAIHSAGLYSYFRVGLPGAFPIVDTHPDEFATTDLRLLSPWPELQAFAADMTKNIESMNDHEHGHLPYVVILLYFLEKWKETHGDYPKKYAEKVEFKKFVAAGARRDNPEGGEENFDEAVAAAVKSTVSASLPSTLKEVFEYPHVESVSASSNSDGATGPSSTSSRTLTMFSQVEQKSTFWIIADAIKKFYEKHGCLPLPGNVPDMKAQSKVYIQLQNIYKTKARNDVAEVLDTVRRSTGGEEIDLSEVELFCKNAAFVKLVNMEGVGADHLPTVTSKHFTYQVIHCHKIPGPKTSSTIADPKTRRTTSSG